MKYKISVIVFHTCDIYESILPHHCFSCYINLIYHLFQTSVNKTATKLGELVVHVLESNSENNAFVVEIHPDNNMTNVTIYGRREEAPTLEKYDFSHTFQNSSKSHQYFLGNETINGLKYYVGVASGVQMNYTFRPYEIGCYYYDEGNRSWTTQGCSVGSHFMLKATNSKRDFWCR